MITGGFTHVLGFLFLIDTYWMRIADHDWPWSDMTGGKRKKLEISLA